MRKTKRSSAGTTKNFETWQCNQTHNRQSNHPPSSSKVVKPPK